MKHWKRGYVFVVSWFRVSGSSTVGSLPFVVNHVSSSSGEAMDVDGSAVGVQGDRAVAVRAEHVRTDLLISLQHSRRGVTEVIAPPHADDGQTRIQCAQERA